MPLNPVECLSQNSARRYDDDVFWRSRSMRQSDGGLP